MPATNLPIPAENAAINRGELYQLTGLTASTRYQFVISSTKNPSVTIAKEKALTTIQAQGNFNGTPFYFTTDAGQTSAYLLVNALEGAVITLNMKADPIPSPSSVTLPATLDPDKWYVVTGLTNGALYELAVSSDAPVTVFSKTGTALATAVENPLLMTQAGSIQFQTTGTSAWLYVDGAFPANVSLKPFTGVVGSGFDPSSDQSITGAWTFSNITVPTPTTSGQAANKGYVDSNFVSKSGNETITGIKTFSSSPVVPSPTENEQAAPKSYVDSAVDSVHEFNPAEAQNITGSWSFSDGLTRATKASPTNTDIMNKEMSDAVYVPKAGDSTVEGTKTFSGSITLANEAPLVLGTGTEAVKISGSGTGSAVIEGGNDATLDVAVPVSLQEPTEVVQIKTDISGVTTDKTIIRFYQAATRLFQMYQYKSTGTLGFQPSGVGAGISVNAQGTCAMESSGIIRGPASFESGVTCSQSLTVAQIATFNGSVALGNSAKISGSVLEESDITDTTYIPVGNSNQRYIKYKELTKADYDALETKSNSTIYFLTDQTMWAIGTKELVTSDMPS